MDITVNYVDILISGVHADSVGEWMSTGNLSKKEVVIKEEQPLGTWGKGYYSKFKEN